jgi:hypothetical protein
MPSKSHISRFSHTLIMAAFAVSLLGNSGCSREAQAAGAQPEEGPWFQIRDGVLKRPVGYREWVYVGTPVTPDSLNNGKAPFPEFHNVYIDPDAWAKWKEAGRFPDGTILMKELVSVGATQAVSGNGFFEGDYIGLEATIKSAKDFPNEPGNWAYYSFTQPDHETLAETAEPFPTSSCNACHQQNAGDDWVFTQYYPVLRAGKAAGSKGIGGVRTKLLPRTAGAMPAPAAMPSQWEPTAPTPAMSPSRVPLEVSTLFEYLKKGEYKKFKARAKGTHSGRGPHTELGLPVRVFYNNILASSLKAGNAVHPAGSTAIKEMFTAEGELQGWAVNTKTSDDTDEGRGWFWYEVTSGSDPNAIAAAGNGVTGCFGCHSNGGSDMVLSGFPLR